MPALPAGAIAGISAAAVIIVVIIIVVILVTCSRKDSHDIETSGFWDQRNSIVRGIGVSKRESNVPVSGKVYTPPMPYKYGNRQTNVDRGASKVWTTCQSRMYEPRPLNTRSSMYVKERSVYQPMWLVPDRSSSFRSSAISGVSADVGCFRGFPPKYSIYAPTHSDTVERGFDVRVTTEDGQRKSTASGVAGRQSYRS